VRVSPGKSVLAGALTLALLVLPTVIRASEEGHCRRAARL
jgi:ABC-type phosphate transport system permease subunit